MACLTWEITNICLLLRVFFYNLMKKSQFDFKQFTICHDRCAMKVGTDGVLLGAWTDVGTGVRRILDVGTGSGLIAIMLAQKCEADIWGVDVDADAVLQAAGNGERTPWSSRLHFLQSDVLEYSPQNGFDLIVCNPPYFENSLRSSDRKRNTARHSENLPFDLLIGKVHDLLEPDGLFNVVLPAQAAEDFAQEAWERGLNLYKKCVVYTKPSAPAKRTLLSLKKGQADYPETIPIYIYGSDGAYTEEYRKLTENYYLGF